MPALQEALEATKAAGQSKASRREITAKPEDQSPPKDKQPVSPLDQITEGTARNRVAALGEPSGSDGENGGGGNSGTGERKERRGPTNNSSSSSSSDESGPDERPTATKKQCHQHNRHQKTADPKKSSIFFTDRATEYIREWLDFIETCANLERSVRYDASTS